MLTEMSNPRENIFTFEMGDYQLQVYVFSEKHHSDLHQVVNLFNGTSSNGTSAQVKVLVPKYVKGWDKDYSLVIDAINHSDDGVFIIVCKDTSISTSDSRTILDVIDAAVESHRDGNPFDLFYLAKWMDRCDYFSNLRDLEGGTKIVDTVSPNGVQCLMFSPEGVKKFLRSFPPHGDEPNPITSQPLGQVLNSRITMRGSAAHKDKSRPKNMQRFIASTCYPNIIQFDITKQRSDAEVLKTHECREIPKVDDVREKPSGGLGFFWFIVIIIICCVLIWAIVKVGVIANAGGVSKYYGLAGTKVTA